MAIDLLGPADAPNFVTTRPAEARIFGTVDTFFKDCSSPGGNDGTFVEANFVNGLLAQIRRAIRGMGITENNADDDMLLKAIQAAATGLATEAQLFACMPIYPSVGTAGLIVTSTGVGSLVVSTGQSIIRRGVKSYLIDTLSLANRTFVTAVSKTYHLRWHAPGTGEATPAASWPVGKLVLKDLADATYNPSALAETNSAFDTTYDDALLARVVTDGSNVLTVTALYNLARLRSVSILQQTFSRTTDSGSSFCAAFTPIVLNWSRSPRMTGAIARNVFVGTPSQVPDDPALYFTGTTHTDGTGTVTSLTTRYQSAPTVFVDLNVPNTALTHGFQVQVSAEA